MTTHHQSKSSTALRTADWLGLAAAPTFAVMAVLTSTLGGPQDLLCSGPHGGSMLTGMAPMYWLMSAFHSAPWLRLGSGELRDQLPRTAVSRSERSST